MAVYKRFTIQQKYLNGVPQEEYRLGMEYDSKTYHSMENCQSGSECTQIEYRWVDVEDDYICEDTTKYAKQKRQQKCVDEEEWVDMYPYQYQKGDMIEEDSKDCGGIHYLYTDTDGNGVLTYNPIQSEYTTKDTVTFRVTPNEGYLFSCYHIGSTSAYGEVIENSVMSLSMYNDWYVKALFKQQMYTLHTSVISGIGSISVFPSSSQYPYGERVFITGVPNESYLFNGFVYGSDSSYRSFSTNDNPIYIDMTTDYWVDAKFKPNPDYFDCLEWGYTNGDVFMSCEPVTGGLDWVKLAKWAYNDNDYKYMNTLSYVNDKNGQVSQLMSCGFSECRSLTYINFPEVSYIPDSCFRWNTGLVDISLPKVEKINLEAFYHCGFSSISLPNLSSFVYNSVYPSMFGGNGVLSDIYLPYSGIVNHFNVKSFYVNCNSNLLIHVPDSLVSAYIESCLGVNVVLSGLTKPLSECIVGLDTLYRVNTYSTQYCDLMVEPSKSIYSYGETVTITAIPTEGFSLDYFMYGSDTNFIESEVNQPLVLTMTNSWYIQPSTSPITGGIYLQYKNGNESWLDFSSSILSSNNIQSASLLTKIYDYGKTVTSVESNTFKSRTNLQYISFPSLTNVGSYAFYGTQLKTIDLPNLEEVGYQAFASIPTLSMVNIPLCKRINAYGFASNTSLEIVDFRQCEYMSYYALYKCSNLVSIDLPNVTTLGTYVFAGCTNLTDVNLPNLEWLRDYTFQSCRSLVSLDLPNVSVLGSGCFMGCNGLTSVNCPKVNYINDEVFYGLTQLENINIDFENVSYIGNRAFVSVQNLTNGNFPNLSIIYSETFKNCNGLVNVDLPVCSIISKGAFQDCANLTSINIPVCEIIRSSAFMFCTKLETIRLDNVSSVPYVASVTAFSGTNITSIYVPSSLYNTFLTTSVWRNFASSKFISV